METNELGTFVIELFTGQWAPSIIIITVVLALVGVISQFALYDRCGLPGIACLVPVWNVTTFLQIMGRPWYHMFLFIFPPPVIFYFGFFQPFTGLNLLIMGIAALFFILVTVILYIDLCKSFGKTDPMDYFLVIVFNGFYVMYLGFSEKVEYKGPAYKIRQELKQKAA